MATVAKIDKDIERTKSKISEWQGKLKTLEAQKVEAEKIEIVNLVKAVKMTKQQLTVLLKAYAKGDITLPEEYEQELASIENTTEDADNEE